jgi:hypothetical protein
MPSNHEGVTLRDKLRRFNEDILEKRRDGQKRIIGGGGEASFGAEELHYGVKQLA